MSSGIFVRSKKNKKLDQCEEFLVTNVVKCLSNTNLERLFRSREREENISMKTVGCESRKSGTFQIKSDRTDAL